MPQHAVSHPGRDRFMPSLPHVTPAIAQAYCGLHQCPEPETISEGFGGFIADVCRGLQGQLLQADFPFVGLQHSLPALSRAQQFAGHSGGWDNESVAWC